MTKQDPKSTVSKITAPAIAASFEMSPLGTPEGYTPKEVSLMLKSAGFPTDGKKIRRLLRAGKMAGVLFSGRWYIPVKSFESYIARLTAKVLEAEQNAAA